MMILWLVIIVGLVYYLYYNNPNGQKKVDYKSAKSILMERLVKGEITIEEFNRLNNTLKENE
jgi:uncharacterized membrane protein